jgi:sirohydrochlorin cobaltochelatase
MRHADSTSPHSTTPAHILLAHGSRDPEWPAIVQAVAARIGRLDPMAQVRCAYLALIQPDLTTAIDELTTEGARTIAVWPMFFGLGHHVRADLPRLIAVAQAQIQARDPGVTITLQPAITEHGPVLDAMAQVIAHQTDPLSQH